MLIPFSSKAAPNFYYPPAKKRQNFFGVFLQFQIGVDTLGHYSAGFTLDTYTHATQRMKREAADTIGSVIDQAM